MDSISSIASTVGIGLAGAAVSRTSMWVAQQGDTLDRQPTMSCQNV